VTVLDEDLVRLRVRVRVRLGLLRVGACFLGSRVLDEHLVRVGLGIGWVGVSSGVLEFCTEDRVAAALRRRRLDELIVEL
jgi:hypothetical protein